MKVYIALVPHTEFPNYSNLCNLGYLRESIWTEYYDYFAIEYNNRIYSDEELVILTGSIPKEQVIKII